MALTALLGRRRRLGSGAAHPLGGACAVCDCMLPASGLQFAENYR